MKPGAPTNLGLGIMQRTRFLRSPAVFGVSKTEEDVVSRGSGIMPWHKDSVKVRRAGTRSRDFTLSYITCWNGGQVTLVKLKGGEKRVRK